MMMSLLNNYFNEAISHHSIDRGCSLQRRI